MRNTAFMGLMFPHLAVRGTRSIRFDSIGTFVISGVFDDEADLYTLTTPRDLSGVWYWAHTAVGVTLVADEVAEWTGGVLLESGTQPVGAENSSIDFTTAIPNGETVRLHVYQKDADGAISNVLSTVYTKNGALTGVMPSIKDTVNTVGSTSASGLVCNLPSNPVIGNWQVLQASGESNVAFSIPSGWDSYSPGDSAPSNVIQHRVFARVVTPENVDETTVTIINASYKNAQGLVHEVQNTRGPGVGVQNLFRTSPSSTSHSGHVRTTEEDNVLLLEALAFRSSSGGASITGGVGSVTNCLVVWGQQEMPVAGTSTPISYSTVQSLEGFAGVLIEMLPGV